MRSLVPAMLLILVVLAPEVADAAWLESDYEPGRDQPPHVPAPPSPPTGQHELRSLARNLVVQAPHHYRGLSVFPLTRRASPEPLALQTLDRAFARGEVMLSELPDGVMEQIRARNLGRRHVLIVAGEIVVGGYQDRAAAHTYLLAPGTTATLDVFCVERGRWDADKAGAPEAPVNTSLRPGGALTPLSVRRRLLRAPSQVRVWAEVDASLQRHGINTDTGRLAAVHHSELARKALPRYREAMDEVLEDQTVGFAVAVGGRVVAMELFTQPDVARASWPRLRDACALEAAHWWNAQGEAHRDWRVRGRQVQMLLRQVANVPVQRRDVPGAGERLLFNRRGIQGEALAFSGRCVHATLYFPEFVIQPMPVPQPGPRRR